MDRRSWLWRRKSSEKSPGETESTGSVSSLSERFSDDQRSQSPELINKPELTREEEATADIKILTERLSAALLNVSLKEDIAKQHAKVAEEAVSGWEKAEKEAAVLKQQLDASVIKVSSLEDRNAHIDSALKECVRQLWQGREEQDQKIQEAIEEKRVEWETTKSELESQIKELQERLKTGKEEVSTTSSSVHEDLYPKLEALEKENSSLKVQLVSKTEEVEVRTLERDLSTQAAESASKQQLEGIKKLTKLEAECRKLRAMVRKSVNSNEIKSFSDNQSENSGRVSFSDNDMQSPSAKKTSMASSSVEIGLMDDFLEMEKLAALPHSESRRQHSESSSNKGLLGNADARLKREHETSLRRISELEEKVEMVEVEKLQLEMALTESKEQIEGLQSRLMETERKLTELKKLEAENQDLELSLDESGKQIQDLQRQLNKAQVNLSELETTRAEKLELTICLNGTKKQLETSQNRLKETERKLTEFQTLLRLTKDAKEAAEVGVKAANAKTEAVESRLRDVEAETESLILKIESLEEGTEKERSLSAKHISKCEEMQDEILKLKHELEHHGYQETEHEHHGYQETEHEHHGYQETEHEPHHMKGFDEDYKLKQEKELAVAASKFADCQRTIASLGQRLQSLASLEDFLIES